MGTWYYEGQGAQQFSQEPSYQLLEAPHMGVHQNIQEAVALLGGAWATDQSSHDRIYAHFEAAERASEEVVMVLDRMVDEHHRSKH